MTEGPKESFRAPLSVCVGPVGLRAHISPGQAGVLVRERDLLGSTAEGAQPAMRPHPDLPRLNQISFDLISRIACLMNIGTYECLMNSSLPGAGWRGFPGQYRIVPS